MESLRVPVFSSTIRAMAGIAACVVLGAALFRSPSAVGADTDGTVDATELDASFPAFYGRGLSVFVKGNPDPEAQTDYEWWTDLLARRAMTSWSFDSKPLPLKLVVSAVTGDDKPRRDPVASFLTGIHVEGVEVATNDFVGQINQHDRWDELKFSPDGRTVAAIRTRGCAMLDIATWRDLFEIAEPRMGERHLPFSSPQFTPDGRYLLLRTREPALRVYDATTGKPAERPPYIPAEAVAFVQAPRQPRAVVQSPSATYLWDTDLLRVIAPLDETGDLSGVAFSPDESRRPEFCPETRFPAGTSDLRHQDRACRLVAHPAAICTRQMRDGERFDVVARRAVSVGRHQSSREYDLSGDQRLERRNGPTPGSVCRFRFKTQRHRTAGQRPTGGQQRRRQDPPLGLCRQPAADL